jgi:hypothetical protein
LASSVSAVRRMVLLSSMTSTLSPCSLLPFTVGDSLLLSGLTARAGLLGHACAW